MPTIQELRDRIQHGLDNDMLSEDEAAVMLARLDVSAIGGNEDNVTTQQVDPWLAGFQAPTRDAHALTVTALMEQGMTELEAHKEAAKPSLDYTDMVDKRYAQQVEQAQAEARAAWDRTPDGKRHAATEALAAQEKRAEDVRLSRALLESQGVPAAGLSDDEALQHAALDAADEPDLANHYGANVQAALTQTPKWGEAEPAEGSAAE